ncbi:MAG: thioesterase family protein [Proteobacteria bacterium]|nr:thioesterase family protein [Pseudomonadota bacterium]
MADFVQDTAVEGGAEPGRYRAELSPDWAVWGPNGGYLAAIALRAALQESRFARPASFQAHFLAIGEFGPVELRVVSQGGGRRAESLRVELLQGERALLCATVWMVADGLEGFQHDVARAPDVPGPDGLRGYQELADNYGDWYPIWRSIEGRPTRWDDGPGEPVWHTWLRLNDTPIRDVESDAIRQLFWLDFPGWNATIAAHAWPFRHLTPNLDLTVQFQRFDPDCDWLLAHGEVPLATSGLVACVSRLWTPDGRLLATGTSKHVCRSNPQYEQELERARELAEQAG